MGQGIGPFLGIFLGLLLAQALISPAKSIIHITDNLIFLYPIITTIIFHVNEINYALISLRPLILARKFLHKYFV